MKDIAEVLAGLGAILGGVAALISAIKKPREDKKEE